MQNLTAESLDTANLEKYMGMEDDTGLETKSAFLAGRKCAYLVYHAL